MSNHASFTMACLPGEHEASFLTDIPDVRVQIRTIRAYGKGLDPSVEGDERLDPAIKVYLVGHAQFGQDEQTDSEWTNLAFEDNYDEAYARAWTAQSDLNGSYQSDLEELVDSLIRGDYTKSQQVLQGRIWSKGGETAGRHQMVKIATDRAIGMIEANQEDLLNSL